MAAEDTQYYSVALTTRPQVEGMQKKKDAGKEVDEQVHNRARL